MVSERDEQFHDLLERFVDVIVDTEGFTRERLVGILVEVAKFFNLSKGVTEFYENLWHEQLGKGEIFIDYDDGRESKVIISLRVVTPVLSVVKCTLYQPVDAEELSEDEYKKLTLIPSPAATSFLIIPAYLIPLPPHGGHDDELHLVCLN